MGKIVLLYVISTVLIILSPLADNCNQYYYFRSLPSPVMGLNVIRSNQVIWYI
jgi:hypothetical protein